jgi:hypothetical protein
MIEEQVSVRRRKKHSRPVKAVTIFGIADRK